MQEHYSSITKGNELGSSPRCHLCGGCTKIAAAAINTTAADAVPCAMAAQGTQLLCYASGALHSLPGENDMGIFFFSSPLPTPKCPRVLDSSTLGPTAETDAL